jgi:hypothetical protein
MARGWLAYVRFIAEDYGYSVIDRDTYIDIPELNIHARLSARTGYPIIYVVDDDDVSNIICYYNRRLRRYICLHRRVGVYQGKTVAAEDYQARYSLIVELCYHGSREKKGSSRSNDLHVECQSVRKFTTRELNKHVRGSRRRGLRSIEPIIKFIIDLRNDLSDCCAYGCYARNFSNWLDLLDLAVENFTIHSVNRYSNSCYMDRCERGGGKPLSMVCRG